QSLAQAVCRQLYYRYTHIGECAALRDMRITFRERQVIGLISQGLSNKEAADRLNIATHTVKSHIHNLFQKFEVRNRVDLIKQCTHWLPSGLPSSCSESYNTPAD